MTNRDNVGRWSVRVSLALMGPFVLGLVGTPVASAKTRRALSVTHQRQAPNLCVPTCASMVLEYYGEHHGPEELKSLATPPDSTFAGTFMSDMVRAVRELGYPWEQQCFATDEAGLRAGLPELKASVREGRPVLVGISSPPIGHVVVLVGLDDFKRELTFIDPNQPAPGAWTMTERVFGELWHENIVDARCAIFTQGRSAE